MRRLIPALAAALAVLATGCGTGSDGSAASSPAPATSAADPIAVVRQGMDRSLSGTLTMDASVKAGPMSIELHGKVDPAARVLHITGNAPEPIEARLIGDAAYVKSDPSDGGKAWMKIDLTKLRPGSTLRQSFDFKSQTGVIGGIVSAEQVGEGRYRGITDLEKAAEAASTESGMRDGIKASAKLAKDPRAIPFEATVDADGRVTELSYTIATKSLGDLVTEMRMSGFGEPVSVAAPPAGETEDADDEAYAFL
ncbi:hypothetical protein GA0070606_4806 [Micromonospora citrea]|uniref:Lipoprotein LprG n=1 Tax=Micromonospora citrea TaxID=47855 RepID=A0A1C6VQQ2_9ACTN|nr:hypothetical protein [Micromonospora citrea]SCL68517.1 hypothetical protein GA0070606_4806 [Micromonospora citrea]